MDSRGKEAGAATSQGTSPDAEKRPNRSTPRRKETSKTEAPDSSHEQEKEAQSSEQERPKTRSIASQQAKRLLGGDSASDNGEGFEHQTSDFEEDDGKTQPEIRPKKGKRKAADTSDSSEEVLFTPTPQRKGDEGKNEHKMGKTMEAKKLKNQEETDEKKSDRPKSKERQNKRQRKAVTTEESRNQALFDPSIKGFGIMTNE